MHSAPPVSIKGLDPAHKTTLGKKNKSAYSISAFNLNSP